VIQAIVFDLDDTLYRERDFVASGYRAVAQYLARKHAIAFPEMHSAMMDCLETHGREAVFAMLQKRFLNPAVPVDELIAVYRSHRPKIRLFPGYRGLLRWLARQYRLGIITDGLPDVQERKVRALGLDHLINHILYTWKFGPEKQKPHPLPFSLMLQALGASPDSVLFVGDNPDKDGKGAQQSGMKYAQLQSVSSRRERGNSAEQGVPELVLDSLFQLAPILRKINGYEGN
jgi:putative hydrolase of the HAD superfamily